MLRNDLYKPWVEGEHWGVEIIDGEFSGVVIEIQKLDIKEDSSGELSVDYHVIHKPELLEENLEQSDLFKNTLEIIVNDILKEAIDSYEQARNDNTEKSDS